MSKPASDPVERFWSHVDKSGDCWLWTGDFYSNGYGLFCKRLDVGRWCGVLAHREAYRLTYDDPGELCVLHRCDNRPCVNPSHLFLGTVRDNVADCIAKGRNSRGGVHPISKLTEEQIMEIRQNYTPRSREHNQYVFAQRYGVCQQEISRIIRGERWREVA